MKEHWRTWRLEREFVYELGDAGSGQEIRVPVGFVTDGASVPQIMWALFPAWGSYSRAAVVHDHLCVCLNEGQPHPLAPTRRHADAIFLEAMKVCGTGFCQRWTMWAAVRLYAICAGK